MKDNFNDNLKKIVSKLSEYSPNADLWKRISDDLDFETELHNKISELPLIDHNPKLWQQINSKLFSIKSKRKLRIATYSSLLAASLALIIVLWNFKTEEDSVIISEEYYIKEYILNPGDLESSSPVNLIKEWCSKSTEKCSSDDFKEDINRLIELEYEIKGINEIIEKYGDSPSLIKSLIKMENEKAMLVKELFKNLRT